MITVELSNETAPDAATIPAALNALITEYESKKNITLRNILDFHARFEMIHPFEDGNGRVGRMLMVKECLRHGIDPFIIDDKHRSEYIRGIAAWKASPTALITWQTKPKPASVTKKKPSTSWNTTAPPPGEVPDKAQAA